jgi:hypothetical protein
MKPVSHPLIVHLWLCAVLLGNCLGVFAGDQPAVAEKPAPKPILTAGQIAQLVKDLGAEKFSVRESAMRDLREAGLPAISPLTQAAKSGDLEVTLRAIRILESLLTTGSLEEFEAAETALEDLRQSGGKSVSSRAEIVLASMGEVREKRAIAAITNLRGSVKSDARQFGFVPNTLPASEDMMTTVVLTKSWKGGEVGLKHLENLRFLRTVYLVEDVLPADAIARLERKLPNLRVQLRGGACLGVGGLGVDGGCEIQLINPGSAADKAGLRAGDLIVAFNGKRGPNEGDALDFDRLVELIKEHDAGAKVPVLIRRNGREQVIPVVLDEWK